MLHSVALCWPGFTHRDHNMTHTKVAAAILALAAFSAHGAKVGTGSALAYQGGQSFLDSLTEVFGYEFTLDDAPNQGWLAIETFEAGPGLVIFDGLGFGGWSGAGLPGVNSGASPALVTQAVTFIDSSNVSWNLYRTDYVAQGTYTIITPSNIDTLADPSDRAYAAALLEPTVPAVPEPSTYALMLLGLGLVGLARRR